MQPMSSSPWSLRRSSRPRISARSQSTSKAPLSATSLRKRAGREKIDFMTVQGSSPLKVLPNEPVVAKKAPVDPATLSYRELLRGPFWQKIPSYREVSEEQFLDHSWQAKNSITKVSKLLEAVQGLVTPAFIEDAEAGFKRSPMSVRVSPYLLS